MSKQEYHHLCSADDQKKSACGEGRPGSTWGRPGTRVTLCPQCDELSRFATPDPWEAAAREWGSKRTAVYSYGLMQFVSWPPLYIGTQRGAGA